jgi:hypothetical protein
MDAGRCGTSRPRRLSMVPRPPARLDSRVRITQAGQLGNR